MALVLNEEQQMLRDSARSLKVLMARRDGRGLRIIPEPVYEFRIESDAGVRFGPSRGKTKAPDLLILENRQVLHVRFP